MLIDRIHIDKGMKKIAEDYPEFKDIEPKITETEVRPQDEIFRKLDLGVPKQFRHIYRLKFTKVVQTEDRVPIDRILMVTLDENFEIIKITESR
jgi:cephalosporin-C deacetylase-like acetyl esterase